MDQIIDYATLQSAVAGLIHRPDDADITDNLPLFVQLCEARLHDMLLLKDMETETTLTSTANVNYIVLPAGYRGPLGLWLVQDSERTLMTPVMPDELRYASTAGVPRKYAIDGANIRFDFPFDAVYSLPFRFIKASNLSVSNTSNYLLLKRPDVYLYGVLVEACGFTKDADAETKYEGRFQAAVRSLKDSEHRNKKNVPLRTDLPGSARRANILTGE